jgi:hypothetical protein
VHARFAYWATEGSLNAAIGITFLCILVSSLIAGNEKSLQLDDYLMSSFKSADALHGTHPTTALAYEKRL